MLGVSLTSRHVVMPVNVLTCFEEDIIMRSPARIDLSAFFFRASSFLVSSAVAQTSQAPAAAFAASPGTSCWFPSDFINNIF